MSERLSVFLNAMARENTPFLEELEEEALKAGIPIIRKEMQTYLRTLLAAIRPHRILEIGTAVGFSALFMCEYGPEGLRLDTIENYEKRIPIARRNFALAGRSAQINLIEGDAAAVLPRLSGEYDLIFMDGAKAQYPAYLPELIRLLRKNGVLLSDNVLQEENILESHYLVRRRDRTIYRRMREYLYTLTHHPLLETSILPIGDGAAFTVRI